MQRKFIISASIIPYKDSGEFLVTERSGKEIQGANLMSYCGGKVDDLEITDIDEVHHSILEDTAIRELEEETGVYVKQGTIELLNNHAFKRFDGDYALMVVFIAKFKEQRDIELDPQEIKAVHWLKFKDIDKDRMYQSVYSIYQTAANRLKK